MEARVYDTNFEAKATIDEFESFIWTDRYDKCGDFELYMPMSSSAFAQLPSDYYLWFPESEHLMIIADHEMISDAEAGDKLKVTGKSLERIIDRRIVWTQTALTGNLQNGIQKLLNDAIINPSDPTRKISNFIFTPSTDPNVTDLTFAQQFTGDNLYDVIQTLCSANNIGFKITLNEAFQFEFELYSGVDRSYAQNVNPYVVFSPPFENLLSSDYKDSVSDYKNVALVGGEGQGSARVFTTVGSGSGLDRRELFVNSASTRSMVDGTTLTTAQYQDQLTQEGLEKLYEALPVKTFEGKIDTTLGWKYGEDFYLGDVVQVVDAYGLEGESRVTEIIFSHDAGQISVIPTFESI